MNIPKQDIYHGLPIRWAFYRFCAGYCNGWEFSNWRTYLMSTIDDDNKTVPLDNNDNVINDILTILHSEDKKDCQFKHNVKMFLEHHKADTLRGFIRFWKECCQEYEKLLIHIPLIEQEEKYLKYIINPIKNNLEIE